MELSGATVNLQIKNGGDNAPPPLKNRKCSHLYVFGAEELEVAPFQKVESAEETSLGSRANTQIQDWRQLHMHTV